MADLEYHPVLGDVNGAIREISPARLLIVGDDVPQTVDEAEEARQRVEVAGDLSTGYYVFAIDDGVAMLVVGDGVLPGAPTEADWSVPEHPLIDAFGWFSDWWDVANLISKPLFRVGDDAVTVPHGQEAKIRRRDFHSGGWFYSVRVGGQTMQMQEGALALPAIDDDPSEWIARPASPARRLAATLTRSKLEEQLSDTVYSFRATRTLFRPYQFRPIMRLLETGGLRMLIADEVGMGKTIEAGLVWTELDARRQANRVLVVCPSMLVTKWRAEMDERFGYDLLALDRQSLDALLDQLENDRLPARFHGVCSLELLRAWGGLQRMAELGPHFDLVIVDEAHAFRNAQTKSHALGALLSDWADALLFLSATPLNLGNSDLYNLLELLVPGEFDDRFVLEQLLEPNALLNRIRASFFDHDIDNTTRRKWLLAIKDLTFGPAVASRTEFGALEEILRRSQLSSAEIVAAKRLISQLHALSAVVTRTRKVEVEDHKAVREARSIAVDLTDIETQFYLEFERWQHLRAAQRGLPVGFVTQMPLRLVSSCIPAARNRLLNRDPKVRDVDLDEVEDVPPDDLVKLAESLGDVDLDEVEDVPPDDLVKLAESLGDVDTKFDAFLVHLLQIVREGHRVLVFTFSRPVLAYLEGRLHEYVRLAVMHGGTGREERHEIMRRFRAYEFDVLLASRVASEGLDFEFCSAVVNYDLPWNPMEVEQRIGRIDRFGQTSDKILILNFHTPGTIETDIIARIHERIGVFNDSIGELEPIIQSVLVDIKRTVFDFTLTDEQRQRRLDEMLSAFEEQRLTEKEVEQASTYLSSTDKAEIDGLEHDLLASGRYVGQSELVLLMEDWVASLGGGAQVQLSSGGEWLTIRGNGEMEAHLRGVQSAGDRSAAELDHLARRLRDEQDITLALDQELARTTGQSLLSATHPLVRAALRVPGYKYARFASVRCASDEAPPGLYFVLLAIAHWTGLRSAKEFWTAAVSLDSYQDAPESVGQGLLAALAQAQLTEGPVPDSVDLDRALERAERGLRTRQASETSRRTGDNEAIATARRISLRETHARKVGQIQRRIETLQSRGGSKVIRLHQAQLQNQGRMLREAEAELDAAADGSMGVEYVAACTVEVVSN